MPGDFATALIALAAAGVASAGTYFATKRTNSTNLQIARERLNAENRVANAAAEAIGDLLRHPQYRQRTFDTLRGRVRGFQDDELRKMLVAAGAVSFVRAADGAELWGLIDRNQRELAEGGAGSPPPPAD
jgi:hypothetical protein